MKDVSVSVVIPLYNAENTIVNSIVSVMEQTYTGSCEVIIINDGSTDGSLNQVELYVKENTHKWNIIIINQENRGVSSARNRGIKEAQGEWIALLDSDDVWLPEKLEKQIVEIKNNSDIKIIGTNRNEEVYPYFGKSKQAVYRITVREALLKWWPSTPTVLFKKEIIAKVGGYDESLAGAEDGEFWLRIMQYYEMYVLNESFVLTGHGKRNFGESGLSADLSTMFKGEKVILKRVYERNQINFMEYIGFYAWLSIKYLRRVIIIKMGFVA